MKQLRAIKTRPNSVPMTGRSPQMLVRQYGFKTVQAFCDSLPKKAVVVDIGAGASRLGADVALQRPDITWINADLAYKDAVILSQVSRGTPKNLRFIAGDVVAFSDTFRELTGVADRVFSYWMIPHLSTNTLRPAEKAVESMWELLKPNGVAMVGPLRQHIFRYDRTFTFTKKDNKAQTAQQLALASRLHPLPRAIQAFGNKHNLHIGNHLLAFVYGIKRMFTGR